MASRTDNPVAVTPDIVEANQRLNDALSSKDTVMPEDMPSVLWALWDASNTLSKVNTINQNTIKKAGGEILAKPELQRTPKDVAILAMFERLFPVEAALQKQLVPTNQPSANIQSLRNPDGSINMAELQKLWDLSPESIKEKFKTLNKWDLKLIIQAIDT